MTYMTVSPDETLISPRTRAHEWVELIETTGPRSTNRTYRQGRHYARLLIPVPTWVVRLLDRIGAL